MIYFIFNEYFKRSSPSDYDDCDFYFNGILASSAHPNCLPSLYHFMLTPRKPFGLELDYYGVRPHSKEVVHFRNAFRCRSANSLRPPTQTSCGDDLRSRGNATRSRLVSSSTNADEPMIPPRGATGSHLITTVNCHSSFRFPPQHTLRARGVCSRIPHFGVHPPPHVHFSAHVCVPYIIPHSPPSMLH